MEDAQRFNADGARTVATILTFAGQEGACEAVKDERKDGNDARKKCDQSLKD